MSDKKTNLTLIFVAIPLLLLPMRFFVGDFQLYPGVFVIPVAAWVGARYSNAGVVVLAICLSPSLFYAASMMVRSKFSCSAITASLCEMMTV